MRDGTRRWLARVVAPAAFLAAATIAIVVVREATAPPDGGGRAGGSTVTATTTTPRRTSGRPRGAPRFVRVRRGDTFESIAARYKTTVESLLVLNPEVDPVALRVGQRVRVR